MSTIPEYLAGYPPMYGVKQESPQFIQGADIAFVIAADTSLPGVRATLKSDTSSSTVLWHGYANYGITQNGAAATVRIPANISNTIPSGIYSLTVEARSDANDGAYIELYSTVFSVRPNAGSPAPIAIGARNDVTSTSETKPGEIMPIVYVP